MDHIQVKVHYTEPVQPVANPALGQSCGIDIALVADVSGSIDDTEMATMKAALTSFANAFDGTPTVFSLTQFADTATILQNFSRTPAQMAGDIAAVGGDGSTNWEDGLEKAFSTFDPRPSKPNLIVFASDGNPTEPGSDSEALEAAILKANEIKTAGTRIIAVGIGGGLNVSNLEDISSADAVYTSDFATLAADLAALAADLCGGTITVNKFINNVNTPAGE